MDFKLLCIDELFPGYRVIFTFKVGGKECEGVADFKTEKAAVNFSKKLKRGK